MKFEKFEDIIAWQKGQDVARLCASNLAKHIKKITSSFGVDYFFRLPLDK